MKSEVEFENKKRVITQKAVVPAKGVLRDSYYYLGTHPTLNVTPQHNENIADFNCWHKRLAHINAGSITEMLGKQVVTRRDVDLSTRSQRYDPCVLVKSTRVLTPIASDLGTQKTLKFVHRDLCFLPEHAL